MRIVLLTIIAVCCVSQPVRSQRPQGQPFSSQLRTDPGVGNVQGIQRYGRPLRTDPDQGGGFTFHVYPVTQYDAYGTRHSGRSDPAITPAQLGEGYDVGGGLSTAETAQRAPGPNRNPVIQAAASQLPSDPYLRMIAQVAADRGKSETLPVVGQPVTDPMAPSPAVFAAAPFNPARPALLGAGDPDPQPETSTAQGETAEVDPLALGEDSLFDQPAATTESEDEVTPDPLADGLDVEADGETEDEQENGEYEEDQLTKNGAAEFTDAALPYSYYGQPPLYPSSFDWTSGLRNLGPPAVPLPMPGSAGDAVLQAGAIDRKGLATQVQQIYQQPLVQIKMRVVEVNRGDSIAAGSILEYVSRDDIDPSLTTGQTANSGFENFRSISRFIDRNLITNATTGTGVLVNLTSEHINWLIQGLSTELSADVITAPEVVTLNGQNVEFVSGDKFPFQLGQNVIQGTNNNVQQVFYKHVGTMVSVTPRIVNWGYHGEGEGERSIQANNVLDWPMLIRSMLSTSYFVTLEDAAAAIDDLDKGLKAVVADALADQGITFDENAIVETVEKGSEWKIESGDEVFWFRRNIDRLDIYRGVYVKPDGGSVHDVLQRHRDDENIPFSAQSEILLALNNYSKGDLEKLMPLVEREIVDDQWCRHCETWKPGDCTIDLAVVVRLSEAGIANTVANPDVATLTGSEKNVRAVANVIQVRSGHGVVMAGLIGERESEEASKVPLLGDLPLVGALFRTKVTGREKTEVLIFVEAKVLDSHPAAARVESAQDFLLGQPYVDGSVLENPLELGMHRTGFGTYLPPGTHDEEIFWERNHRAVRRAYTHIGDLFEP